MKKIMWSIVFIALFSVPNASAQEVDYHSNSAVSFYGTYNPPMEEGEDNPQGDNSGNASQGVTNYSELPKTGENNDFSLLLGVLLFGLSFILKRKLDPEVKEKL